MKKRALYITKYVDDYTTVGYRYSNIVKYSTDFLDIDLLHFPSAKRNLSLFNKIVNKLFIYPDFYWFRLFKYKRQINKKLIKSQYDLAVIGVLPFSFLNLASFIKQKQPDLKIIVDMTDPLTANVSYVRDTFFHKKFILWYEKKHFKNIDTLIVLNDEIKNYYHHKYSFLKNIIVLEQGINPDTFTATVQKVNKKLEVIYAGMLYKKIREPFRLYDAINQYKGSIRLSVYGSFKKRFLPPENERFFYGGKIDRAILSTKFSETDVIVFIDNFYGLQIPGKILEILAINKPILFVYENDNSPTLKYVKDFEGIFYSKNNTTELLKQLEIIVLSNNRRYKRDLTKYYWVNLVKNLFESNPDLLN